ncbi:hypothetical protein C8J31_11441 [Rhizobium sp. PP-CC-2G-626]|nr:hypothetical protein C8J31_11441 [Rhizobium sp. PP-CC-2G-626]
MIGYDDVKTVTAFYGFMPEPGIQERDELAVLHRIISETVVHVADVVAPISVALVPTSGNVHFGSVPGGGNYKALNNVACVVGDCQFRPDDRETVAFSSMLEVFFYRRDRVVNADPFDMK